jgi:hypothetical protein
MLLDSSVTHVPGLYREAPNKRLLLPGVNVLKESVFVRRRASLVRALYGDARWRVARSRNASH